MPAQRPTLADEWGLDMDADGCARAVRAGIFEELAARHAEPHRRYHGASHLTALFDLLRRHAPRVSPGAPARLAVWWHDAVYDPKAGDNEERSADLARTHLSQMHAPAVIVENTAELILRTKHHWRGTTAGDGDYFLDADIAILGAPPAAYDAYAAGVRQEYAWADDAAFAAGRSAFLKSALARPKLFRTREFEHAFAAQARANMTRELAALA